MPDALSQKQADVNVLVQRGLTAPAICEELGISPGVLAAQMTRIRSKGHKCELHTETPISEKPKLPTSDREVLDEVKKGDPANYDVDAAIKANPTDVHEMVRDVQPMVMFGITVQFVKMCGGRMHAHQTIEDMYQALKLFTGDMTPDKGGETKDLMMSEWSGIADKLSGLTAEIEKVIGKAPQPK